MEERPKLEKDNKKAGNKKIWKESRMEGSKEGKTGENEGDKRRNDNERKEEQKML